MMGSDGMYLNSPVFYASLVPKDTFSNSTFFHSPVLMQSVCQQRRERGSYLLKMFALLGQFGDYCVAPEEPLDHRFGPVAPTRYILRLALVCALPRSSITVDAYRQWE